MLALHFLAGRAQVRETRSRPLPRGWARIAVLRSGICKTDLELLRGYHAFTGVPGHEFVGRVIATHPPRAAWLGTRVVGEINISCRGLGIARAAWCDLCRRGWPRHCRRRRVMGIVDHSGAHAEEVTLPLCNLHRVPAGISDAAAVFTEPLAAACALLEQIEITAKHRIIVQGDGKLGLLIAQVLAAHRPRELLLLGHHPDKLRLARSWGLEARLASVRLPSSWRQQFDLVVEASGSTEGLTQALDLVRPRGTIVLKTTVHDHIRIDSAPLVVNEVTVMGSRCGPFPPALHLLQSGKVRVEELIEESYPLRRAPAALRHAARRGVRKIMLAEA